jgi:O-acetyl-ADP-ribose deacetylase (regulator of RNase III)
MSLIELEGDMFSAETDAFAHGVNCQGVMGAGVAREMARRYPDMVMAYRERCTRKRMVAGEVMTWEGPPTVFNLATQVHPGANARLAWVQASLASLIDKAEDLDIRSVAMPRIGCGIGGLDWMDVRPLVERQACQTKIELRVYSLPQVQR